MRTPSFRFFLGLCVALAFGALPAVAASGLLSGTVVVGGHPAAYATVTVHGNNIRISTIADSDGKFAFATLAPGSYTVEAIAKTGEAGGASIDLSAEGASMTLAVGPREIGMVTSSSGPGIRGSGTDVTLNETQITRSPASGSLPALLLQMPGAARGANGVVHMNGDHGDINYVVDGVSIPQELNRNIGTEFDPNDVAFINVLEGAYPAQYGERFASVVTIGTRSGSGVPGYTADFLAGSYGHVDSTLAYHGNIGRAFFVAALSNERTDRALDPPNFNSPHNTGSNANQFLRFTLPHGNDYTNLTLSHSYRTYQIPNDVLNGAPSTTDDDELQDDLFVALQTHHAIGDHGSLTFGPAYKRSRIRDLGDAANDFTFGEALNLASGGTSTDCAKALSTGIFTNATCAYSLNGDRTATDYRFNVDYVLASRVHQIGAGATYDASLISKTYAISLQPGNFLAPVLAPGNSLGAYTVVDNAPSVGHTVSAYIQDQWKMGTHYQLDYGVRYDALRLASTQFSSAFQTFSPRIKFTRSYGPRAAVYAYYGRFFTPFSFENVSPSAAQLLNLPLQRNVANFDLRPQRDSVYEVGAHLPVGSGDLGLRIMQKNAADLIDDTQVGVTLLHQDINYQVGRIATQTVYYQHPLSHGGHAYISVNHTYSVNRGCETQLMAPCFGSPTDWTPADHEQRWGSIAGVLANDAHGGWLSVNGEYSSGLSSASCPPGTPGYCKRTPHITFDAEKGIALGHHSALTFRVQNLLNDRYYVTFANAQGNHYAAPRTFDIGLRFGH